MQGKANGLNLKASHGYPLMKLSLTIEIDFIPDYLHPDTQVALRIEMEKTRSSSDEEGFIYTFEIRGEPWLCNVISLVYCFDPFFEDPNSPSTIKLKVGRTVNVVKRLNQWSNQCGSKEQVLRGFYPGTVDDDDDTAGGSLMKGRVAADGPGVWCHRLERLIHLELADLAVNKPYLEPGWKPFNKGDGMGKGQQGIALSVSSHQKSPTPKKSSANGIGNGGKNKPCKDCVSSTFS